MELPFHLKTLEPLPGALDIIRFFGTIDSPTADADEICENLDLSERRFSKAIRRLVTKGYVLMDGDMVYRLTEQGQRAVEELGDYDTSGGESDEGSELAETSEMIDESEPAIAVRVMRRLVLVVPGTLVTGQPANVILGFNPASPDAPMPAPVELVARFSVINGEPEAAEELLFSLSDDHVQQVVRVVPDRYDQVRIRVEVFQLGEDLGAVEPAGGMYVDVPVRAQGENDEPVAYGTDITIIA
jgi:DNA-binding MarR family transcriptional regulator